MKWGFTNNFTPVIEKRYPKIFILRSMSNMLLVEPAAGFGAVGDTQVFVNIFEMVFDGVLTDVELLSDLAIGVAVGDQLQNFTFAF